MALVERMGSTPPPSLRLIPRLLTPELRVGTATYTGSAVGMSVHKTFDANAKQTSIASGLSLLMFR